MLNSYPTEFINIYKFITYYCDKIEKDDDRKNFYLSKEFNYLQFNNGIELCHPISYIKCLDSEDLFQIYDENDNCIMTIQTIDNLQIK